VRIVVEVPPTKGRRFKRVMHMQLTLDALRSGDVDYMYY
jgi:hypothetical protein